MNHYMNVLLAMVRTLECKCCSYLVSYSIMCCVDYALMCILVLRGIKPQYIVDSHYVIMLTNVQTLTLHACLQVE